MNKIITEVVGNTIDDISFQGNEVHLHLSNGETLTFTGMSQEGSSNLMVQYEDQSVVLIED